MTQGPEARARKVQRRDEVKARLGQALITVAQDRPYSAITVEHIASAAGISRSTFYFYYRDKAELLVDSARGVVERMFSQSDEYLHGSGDPRTALREALARNVATFAEHTALLRVTMEVSTFDEQVGEFWRGSVDAFVEAVAARMRADQASGAISADLDADRFADALVVTTLSYLFRTVGTNGDSADAVAEVLAEIWNRVLYPAPG